MTETRRYLMVALARTEIEELLRALEDRWEKLDNLAKRVDRGPAHRTFYESVCMDTRAVHTKLKEILDL